MPISLTSQSSHRKITEQVSNIPNNNGRYNQYS